jgi:hypothetical protein
MDTRLLLEKPARRKWIFPRKKVTKNSMFRWLIFWLEMIPDNYPEYVISMDEVDRGRNDIRPGTVIEFDLINGKIVGTKKEPQDALHTWRGKGRLPEGFSNVDAYLDEVRG